MKILAQSLAMACDDVDPCPIDNPDDSDGDDPTWQLPSLQDPVFFQLAYGEQNDRADDKKFVRIERPDEIVGTPAEACADDAFAQHQGQQNERQKKSYGPSARRNE